MRILRLLIISAVLLFLIVTGMSLLIPFDVRISRATNMKASPAAVWTYVDDMRQWKEWNPFFSGPVDSQVVYTDTAGGKPAGLNVTGTSVRWMEKKNDERIASMNKKGFKPVLTGWHIITHPATDSTTVQWYMDFKLRWYPWEKFSSLLFEKNYGTRMEQGLNNLKKLAESNR